MVLLVEVLFRPSGPASEPFIIDKDATVFDRRLALYECSPTNHQLLLMLRHDISPPIPRRHANGLRERQQTERRSAAVAAHDNQCFTDVLCRLLNGGHQERLPLAANLIDMDFPFGYQLVNQIAFSDGSCYDGISGLYVFQPCRMCNGGLRCCHAFHIVGQQSCGNSHHGIILIICADGGGHTIII